MNFKLKITLLAFISFLLNQENSGYEYRRSAVHNGNLVKTVFSNWGVIGQPTNKGPGGAWRSAAAID